MCRRSTNEIFSVAGTRDGASPIVSVRAGANHRRVADSSGHFVCRPTCRSRRGQITVLIHRDGSHCAVPVLIGNYEFFFGPARPLFLSSLHLLKRIPTYL